MHTTRPLSSTALPFPHLTVASLISGIGRRLKVFLTRRAQICVADARPANLPVAGRVVAISSVEFFSPPKGNTLAREVVTQALKQESAVASPYFASRRPGVQGRWKASDRVALF